jgi:DNA-binding protein H-NS
MAKHFREADEWWANEANKDPKDMHLKQQAAANREANLRNLKERAKLEAGAAAQAKAQEAKQQQEEAKKTKELADWEKQKGRSSKALEALLTGLVALGDPDFLKSRKAARKLPPSSDPQIDKLLAKEQRNTVRFAMLLAAAKHLSKHRNFDGTVYLIFQPAEEGRGGALAMIGEGLFDRYPMEAVFGMHNWPQMPAGTVYCTTAPLTSMTVATGAAPTGSDPHSATAAAASTATARSVDRRRCMFPPRSCARKRKRRNIAPLHQDGANPPRRPQPAGLNSGSVIPPA